MSEERRVVPVEILTCDRCGEEWAAIKNATPGVERLERCQRCLNAELADYKRFVVAYAAPQAGVIICECEDCTEARRILDKWEEAPRSEPKT